MRQTPDILSEITTSIVRAVEAGTESFQMPWNQVDEFPLNVSSGQRYRGINVLVLWAAAIQHGYSTPLWATYRQWLSLGAQVRRGQKANTVVFWKFIDQSGADEPPEDLKSAGGSRPRCLARAYYVFNADQTDGFSTPEVSAISDTQRIQS